MATLICALGGWEARSHSWQTKPWLKYGSILFRSNGTAAFILGTLSALLTFSLKATGVFTGQGVIMLVGTLVYYLTLLFWRRRTLVFLDIACVNQVDEYAKSEALVSMGAFLKHSKTLVVLWDATFVKRSWACCFLELKVPETRKPFLLQVYSYSSLTVSF